MALEFIGQPLGETRVFDDTLTKCHPYVAEKPRNHDSLFYVTAGALRYTCGETCAVIPQGGVGYIGKGAADTSAADGDAVSYIAINFCIDRSETSHTPALPFPVRCDDDSCDYGTLFADALRADQLREPGGALERDGLILQIIGRLYRAYRLPEPQRRLLRRVAPAVQLLRTDCASPALTVDTLAQSCAMSARQFRTVFRAAYGVPPYRYLQEFRLQKAALLLRSTTKSVTAIAEACGFSDIYSFSHSYKARFGRSPLAERG